LLLSVKTGERFPEFVRQFGGVIEVRFCELRDGQDLGGCGLAGRTSGKAVKLRVGCGCPAG
jgi:hypothetical protein